MLGRALAWESEGMGLSLALPCILGFVSLGQITLPPGFILFLCRVRQILAFKVVKRLWRIWDVKMLAECQGFLVGLSLSTQYPQEIVSRTPKDTKVHHCSSPI